MADVVNINDVLDGHVSLTVDCIDRLYLNAYCPTLQVGGQVVRFLTEHLGNPIPSPALFEKIGNRFRREVDHFAAGNDIPLLHLKKPDRTRWDDRKLDHVRPHLDRAVERGRFGVVGGIGLSGGVFGQTASATAVFGIATGSAGFAGGFLGPVLVSGHLLVIGGLDVIGTKNFKIDHPSDPENKYLVHTCVESSEMKNVYDGAARLDEDGSAWVELPEWFEALNGDFRYQLTAVGGPAPGLHVAEEISGRRFKIAGGEAGLKVCWQVTGSRKDPWAAANPFEVEQEKREHERGRYLEPGLYDAPEEQRITVEPVAATLRAATGSPTGQDAMDELLRRTEDVEPPSRATGVHLDQMDEARRRVEEQRRELAELLRRMNQQAQAPPETT